MKLFSAIRERVDKASKNAEYRAMRFVDTLNVDHPIVKDTVERIESAYADTARLLEAIDLAVEALQDSIDCGYDQAGHSFSAIQNLKELSDRAK